MPVCNACGKDTPRSGYSKAQLSKGDQRRCKLCVGGPAGGSATPPAAMAAAAKTSEAGAAPRTALVCSACERTDIPKAGYSKAQLGKGDQRRCKQCVEGTTSVAATTEPDPDFEEGIIVEALFTDGEWYDAEILAIKNGKYKILYVDYEEKATVSADKLRWPEDADEDDDNSDGDDEEEMVTQIGVSIRKRIRPNSISCCTAFPHSGKLLPPDAAVADIVVRRATLYARPSPI